VDLSATIVIDRPTTEVFDYVMAVSHDAEWRTGVVEAGFTSEAPLGVGTTGFDQIEAQGREMSAQWTVFEFKPGALARWTLGSGPIRGTGGYICQPEGAKTRFTLEARVTPSGWYRLIGPIFRRIGRQQNMADVQKLKSILEAPD
jgi:hypothetical protein